MLLRTYAQQKAVQNTTTLGIGGLGGIYGTAWANMDLVTNLYAGTGDRTMSAMKGILGEDLMHRLIGQSFFTNTQWSVATPIGAPHGIDGLFFKLDQNGIPSDMLIMEAKVFSSQLGTSAKVGKQMSEQWIGHYLKRSATTYEQLATSIQNEKVKYGVISPQGEKVIKIPLGNGKEVLFESRNGSWFVDIPNGASPEDVKAQLRLLSRYMEKGAVGSISFRARVFRWDEVQGQHRITFQEIDPQTLRLGKKQVIQGRFSELPNDVQKSLKASFKEILKKMNVPKEQWDTLIDKMCKEPDYARTMRKKATYQPNNVISWRQIGTVFLLSGIMAMVINGLLQFRASGRINFKQMVYAGIFTSIQTVVGLTVGTHVTHSLLGTDIGRTLLDFLPGVPKKHIAEILGQGVGFMFALTGVTLIQFSMGLIDRRLAYRQIAVSTVSVSSTLLLDTLLKNSLLKNANRGMRIVGGGGLLIFSIAVSKAVESFFATIDDKAQFHFRRGKAEINFIAVKNCNQVEWKFLSTAM